MSWQAAYHAPGAIEHPKRLLIAVESRYRLTRCHVPIANDIQVTFALDNKQDNTYAFVDFLSCPAFQLPSTRPSDLCRSVLRPLSSVLCRSGVPMSFLRTYGTTLGPIGVPMSDAQGRWHARCNDRVPLPQLWAAM
jgi:hypothetical protein